MTSNPPIDRTDMGPLGGIDCAGFARDVTGLGPGSRVVLWLRGCTLRCKGCMTAELWAPGRPSPIEPLAGQLCDALEGCDGLTVSGGEPFQQAPCLWKLLFALRQRREVEVLVYSGYTLEELRAMPDRHVARLLQMTDLLVDGRFEESQGNSLAWRGSDNQRLHLLSSSALQAGYSVDAPWVEPRPLALQRRAPTTIRIIGIPRRGDLALLESELVATGLVARRTG